MGWAWNNSPLASVRLRCAGLSAMSVLDIYLHFLSWLGRAVWVQCSVVVVFWHGDRGRATERQHEGRLLLERRRCCRLLALLLATAWPPLPAVAAAARASNLSSAGARLTE